jgi:hypothetical protein
MNERDMLLTMTICKLLGREVHPPEVEAAFKQAREGLKILRESDQSVETRLAPPRL